MIFLEFLLHYFLKLLQLFKYDNYSIVFQNVIVSRKINYFEFI